MPLHPRRDTYDEATIRVCSFTKRHKWVNALCYKNVWSVNTKKKNKVHTTQHWLAGYQGHSISLYMDLYIDLYILEKSPFTNKSKFSMGAPTYKWICQKTIYYFIKFTVFSQCWAWFFFYFFLIGKCNRNLIKGAGNLLTGALIESSDYYWVKDDVIGT
jgi:hypothetical protein